MQNRARARRGTKILNAPWLPDLYFYLFQKASQLRTSEDKQKMLSIIKQLPYFKPELLTTLTNNSVIDRLLSSMQYRRVAQSEPVYHEGDPASDFYILLKGEIKLFQPRQWREIERDKAALREYEVSNQPITSEPQSAVSQSRSTSYAMNSPTSTLRSNTPVSGLRKAVSIPKTMRNKSTQDFTSYITHAQKSSFANPSQSRRESKARSSSKSSIVNSPKTSIFSKQPRADQDSPLGRLLTVQKPSGLRRKALCTATNFSELFVSLTHHAVERTELKTNAGIPSLDQEILEELSQEHKRYKNGGICGFKHLKTLLVGEGFGEFAHKASGRSETAVAIVESHLIVIEHQDYLDIFDEPIRERVERISTFTSLLGHDISGRYLRIFVDLFELQRFCLNHTVFSQGDEADGLYMVKKGEVKLVYNDVRQAASSKHKLQHKTSTLLELARLSENHFFGSESIFGAPKRRLTAQVASASCEILFLPRKYVVDPLYYAKEAIERIASRCQVTEHWEDARIGEIQQSTSNIAADLQKILKKGEFLHRTQEFSEKEDYHYLLRTKKEKLVSNKHQSSNNDVVRTSSDAKNAALIRRDALSIVKKRPSEIGSEPQSDHLTDSLRIDEANKTDHQHTSLAQFKSLFHKKSTTSYPRYQSRRLHLKSLLNDSELLQPSEASFQNSSKSKDIDPLKHKRSTSTTTNGSHLHPSDNEFNKTSLWKVNIAQNSAKIKNMFCRNHRDTKETISDELIGLYESQDLFAKVNQTAIKAAYSVRNSFSNTPASSTEQHAGVNRLSEKGIGFGKHNSIQSLPLSPLGIKEASIGSPHVSAVNGSINVEQLPRQSRSDFGQQKFKYFLSTSKLSKEKHQPHSTQTLTDTKLPCRHDLLSRQSASGITPTHMQSQKSVVPINFSLIKPSTSSHKSPEIRPFEAPNRTHNKPTPLQSQAVYLHNITSAESSVSADFNITITRKDPSITPTRHNLFRPRPKVSGFINKQHSTVL